VQKVIDKTVYINDHGSPYHNGKEDSKKETGRDRFSHITGTDSFIPTGIHRMDRMLSPVWEGPLACVGSNQLEAPSESLILGIDS
jgi:hypothetical protein